MSHFAPTKSFRLDLGNDEYIEVKNLPFEEFIAVFGSIGASTDPQEQMKASVPLAKQLVSGWRLLDEDGKEVPFDAEKIGLLDVQTMVKLQAFILECYQPEKKS